MKTIRFFAVAGDRGSILAKRERDEGWQRAGTVPSMLPVYSSR